MSNLIDDLKRGRTSAWVAASTIGYLAAAFFVVQAASVTSGILHLPRVFPTLVFLALAVCIPVAPIAGVLKARAIRRSRIEEASPDEEKESTIHMLEQERDFYRSLVEDKDRAGVAKEP